MDIQFSALAINHYKNISSKDLSFLCKPQISSHFNYELIVNWHDSIVNFKIENELFYKKCLNYFPKTWILDQLEDTDFNVYIHSDVSISDDFWEDENSDCHFFANNENELCLQRDFIAKKYQKNIHALCRNELSDGFFNLMRWLLPSTWIKQNKFLMHSSCIIDDQNQAYLCLGPSGAGKSTISSFRDKNFILGDDMNLLTIKNYKAYITPSLLGQRFENNQLFGESFPLKDIFWLVQADINQLTESTNSPSLLYLSQSLVNIFWKKLTNHEMMIVQNLIRFTNSKYKIKELQFNLNGDIWDYVFKHYHIQN